MKFALGKIYLEKIIESPYLNFLVVTKKNSAAGFYSFNIFFIMNIWADIDFYD